MKSFLVLVIVYLLFTNSAFAQLKNPVKWNYAVKQEGGKCKIYVRAIIEQGWHIYAQKQPVNAIGFPTRLKFTTAKGMLLPGTAIESGIKEEQRIDDLDIVQFYYTNKVDFIFSIGGGLEMFPLSCKVSYMACTETECLPVTEQTFHVQAPRK